jgi:glycine betaine transporter
MFPNPLLLTALALTGAIAFWGIVDTAGLSRFAATMVGIQFTSRTRFIILTVSLMLIACIVLAVSPYGRIKLGADPHCPNEASYC